ncbi:hypothetical protein F443_07111 [Phytophthora nicotianae P1569]|uniref:Uncharacterized protein n=1 Tax=Phytophthora nicotianae P1569 TaxID=1317065 RepID=V9FBT2_PHYNI|nr:hypothetical protein F443_07111 [Phytophthora nicotianae P1569]
MVTRSSAFNDIKFGQTINAVTIWSASELTL